jgi:hypothetical protein
MYTCKLTKIVSNHTNLRTDEIVGFCHDLPAQDQDFLMFSSPLVLAPGSSRGLRVVHTTEVQKVETIDSTELIFKTRNSTYKLSEIKELADEKVSADLN